MKRRTLLQGIVATSAFSVRSFAYAQSAADTEPFGFALEHRTDRRDAPIVYFVRDVTPEALERLYATMQKAAPDVIGGKVAIKMSFESDAAPRLDPALVGVLAKKTDATLIDNNVYSARRDNAKDHRELARDHGYAAVAPIDILDADGDMELPITGGVILKHAMTGKHFADYDSVISLVRFKPHYLPRYGGTLKNLSICMGSLAGKAWIHSGGKVSSHYVYSDENTTSQAMADAAKGAVDAKKNRWMFFNVLAEVKGTDDCGHDLNMPAWGIFASLDPVAVDQVALDIAYRNSSLEEKEFHCIGMTQMAEKIGVGSTRYRLVEVK